jgi:peptidyl-prolyl cis-trans isomerase A (cyclophilin A)
VKPLILSLFMGAALLAQAPAPSKTNVTKQPAARPAGASARLMNPAALVAKAPDVYQVKFTTTKGDFTVEVHRDWAPLGADRFYNLARNGFFTNASFFRVVPNFIVQFGIPASPAVANVWQNAKFRDDPVKQSNKKGTIVFATAGPNTRTTQLFINLGDNAGLDRQGFAPFGTVAEGMDVVQQLYSGYGDGSDMGGRGPLQDRIQKEGKPYLDKGFPLLDSIKTATVAAAPAAAAPEAKK